MTDIIPHGARVVLTEEALARTPWDSDTEIRFATLDGLDAEEKMLATVASVLAEEPVVAVTGPHPDRTDGEPLLQVAFAREVSLYEAPVQPKTTLMKGDQA